MALNFHKGLFHGGFHTMVMSFACQISFSFWFGWPCTFIERPFLLSFLSLWRIHLNESSAENHLSSLHCWLLPFFLPLFALLRRKSLRWLGPLSSSYLVLSKRCKKGKVGTIGEVAIRSEVCHLLQNVVLGTFSLFNTLLWKCLQIKSEKEREYLLILFWSYWKLFTHHKLLERAWKCFLLCQNHMFTEVPPTSFFTMAVNE